MRIDTITGLHGTLICYNGSRALKGEYGEAIVMRDDPTFPERPYSVHTLYHNGEGLCAENGRYDLTLEEALAMLEISS